MSVIWRSDQSSVVSASFLKQYIVIGFEKCIRVYENIHFLQIGQDIEFLDDVVAVFTALQSIIVVLNHSVQVIRKVQGKDLFSITGSHKLRSKVAFTACDTITGRVLLELEDNSLQVQILTLRSNHRSFETYVQPLFLTEPMLNCFFSHSKVLITMNSGIFLCDLQHDSLLHTVIDFTDEESPLSRGQIRKTCMVFDDDGYLVYLNLLNRENEFFRVSINRLTHRPDFSSLIQIDTDYKIRCTSPTSYNAILLLCENPQTNEQNLSIFRPTYDLITFKQKINMQQSKLSSLCFFNNNFCGAISSTGYFVLIRINEDSLGTHSIIDEDVDEDLDIEMESFLRDVKGKSKTFLLKLLEQPSISHISAKLSVMSRLDFDFSVYDENNENALFYFIRFQPLTASFVDILRQLYWLDCPMRRNRIGESLLTVFLEKDLTTADCEVICEVLKFLLRNECPLGVSRSGSTPLHLLFQLPSVLEDIRFKMVNLFLDYFSTHYNSLDDEPYSDLFGHTNEDGRTAYHYLCHYQLKNPDMLRMLQLCVEKDFHADKHISIADRFGDTIEILINRLVVKEKERNAIFSVFTLQDLELDNHVISSQKSFGLLEKTNTLQKQSSTFFHPLENFSEEHFVITAFGNEFEDIAEASVKVFSIFPTLNCYRLSLTNLTIFAIELTRAMHSAFTTDFTIVSKRFFRIGLQKLLNVFKGIEILIQSNFLMDIDQIKNLFQILFELHTNLIQNMNVHEMNSIIIPDMKKTLTIDYDLNPGNSKSNLQEPLSSVSTDVEEVVLEEDQAHTSVSNPLTLINVDTEMVQSVEFVTNSELTHSGVLFSPKTTGSSIVLNIENVTQSSSAEVIKISETKSVLHNLSSENDIGKKESFETKSDIEDDVDNSGCCNLL
ncbi:hypothetical protein PCE1_000003 [Barthelona sp. PCE]